LGMNSASPPSFYSFGDGSYNLITTLVCTGLLGPVND
jgi:hypothetical protein